MSSSGEPRNARVLHLDLRVHDGVAEAFVNDVPVSRVGAPPATLGLASWDLPRRESRPIHLFTMPGINLVRVELRGLPGAGRPVPGPTSAALLRLAWFAEGEMADSDTEGRVIAELELRPPPLAGVTAGVPHDVASTSVDLGTALARPIWAGAEVLSLDEAVVDRAHGAITELASSLAVGDTSRVLAMLELYAQDFARAYPAVGRAGIDGIHRDFVQELARGGGVRVAPRATWQPRLVADGRLLDPRRADGGGVVTLLQADGLEIELPLLVGWRAGELLLLR